MRINDITFSNNWTMYFWTGLSWKWVLCAPDGFKYAMNDELEPDQIDEAKKWAERIMEER